MMSLLSFLKRASAPSELPGPTDEAFDRIAAAERGDAEAQALVGYAHYTGTSAAQDVDEALKWWARAAAQGHVSSQFLLGDVHLERAADLRTAPTEAVTDADDESAPSWKRTRTKRESKQEKLARAAAEAAERFEARRYLRIASDAGAVEAKCLLAGQLDSRALFSQQPTDDSEAARLYRTAGEFGDGFSQAHLGAMYAEGRGVIQSPVEAMRWYLAAAAKGSRSAQGSLAYLYTVGDGVPLDYVEAAKWWKLAAESDHRSLEDCPNYSWPGPLIQADTMFWLCEAAEDGWPLARDVLSFMAQGEFSLYSVRRTPELVRSIEGAAEMGDSRAQALLGLVGEDGYTRDNYAGVVAWFRRAAAQGVAIAQRKLGDLHQHNAYPERNLQEALMWYQRAAELGDVESQFALGWLLGNRGVASAEEYTASANWLARAAKFGHARAQYALAKITMPGHAACIGVKPDLAQAVRWYSRSAEQGYAKAQYELAAHYEQGWGVAEDQERSVTWLRRAAEQGHEGAQRSLAQRYYEGVGVDRDGAQAAIWYRNAERSRERRF